MNCRLSKFRSEWGKGLGSALFPTDSWIDPKGATVNVREKELACKERRRNEKGFPY
jgi:hypothetical protein